MESEDEQEAETTRMAQAPGGNAESANVEQDSKQEVAACSWVWRIGRRCKEWFFQSKCHWLCLVFGFILMVIILAFVVKPETSHHGKFPPEQCPSEWIGYKNKCYFISEEEKNWTSSQTFCAKNESLLAVFENQEEMRSLTKRLKIDDSWIGLRKKGESFYWENGIALKVDSFQIRNHSECAYLDAFTISTSACSLPRRWICVKLP
ncbi:C-type lectin domain family 2 member L-like [Aquila chrysaetos chrysaetos]|uniref:C-type lectin domain family 2 member L-like n=1 Tax=Aquila chrysaetos chrysaetos TaxID=223781 RepID=A0A663EFX7_AQUCH|nr:C-type lectin domain family 2 member L-like [Aquila chrysaetos chrysaetos]XP_029896413.1 C-type lectin domain family 2 member L-like [Aquila chrysaetos chrysaetos]XP_029896415.1 C-type lectin domain family 2 member L-like [Aquila chrysaetos chrysaetos]XP_029896416.1 C-type lectin domain family 2 member L-like [Aquila chrysaetos chrysaetos]